MKKSFADTFSINKYVLMGNSMRTRARARILPRERLLIECVPLPESQSPSLGNCGFP